MKTVIAMLSLAVSANVFAYSLADSTVLTAAAPIITSMSISGQIPQKQAAMVLNDSQEYIQSGRLSAFLGQKIKDVQSVSSEVSEQEALDMLITEAHDLLN